jgi:anti-sigma B factor antagonist
MRSLHVRVTTRRRSKGGSQGFDLSTRSRSTGSQATVRVTGEVDLVTAPMLKEALESAQRGVRKSRSHPELLIDLSDVTFLSAAGLSVLADVYVRCVSDGTTMHIVGRQRAVRLPLKLTGLDRLLVEQ